MDLGIGQIYFFFGIGDHFFRYMSVDIHGYADISVTQKILSGFDIHTFFCKHGCIGMAEIVGSEILGDAMDDDLVSVSLCPGDEIHFPEEGLP